MAGIHSGVQANRRMPIERIGLKDNSDFRWVQVEGITVYACSWFPNTDMSIFLNFLDRLEGSVRTVAGTVIVDGDFNTKLPEWSAHKKNIKRKTLVGWAVSLRLVLCNIGDKLTFSRSYDGGVSRSHIEITFASLTFLHYYLLSLPQLFKI